MNSTFFVIIILILLMLIGFLLKRKNIADLIRRLDFTVEYNNMLVGFLNGIIESGRYDSEKYIWLTEKVHAMQSELGAAGLVDHYSDHLKGYSARNFQLLINFLPEVREYIGELDNSLMRSRFGTSAGMCTDMFLRHKGDLKEAIEKESKLLYNPFTCISEAVRYIIALPLSILYWLGILPERILYRIKYSFLLKLINTIIMLIGILSSLVTIVLGWDGFLKIVKQLLQGMGY